MTYNAAVRPTFSQLIQSVNASVRAAFKGALPSSHKNLLTRLRKAVIVLGHTLESEAALMLGASVLDQNVARLREHQFGSAHERNDIVSAVRRWSCWAAERYPTPAEGKPERLIKQKTLATLLKRAYARQNLSHRELVREARIPLSSFERWLRGRLPDERSIEGLLRLAAILNLDSHQVLGCISHRHVRPVPKVDTPYGAYLRERRKPENRYLLSRRDINAQLAEQWYDYVRCQTTAIPVEKRPTNRGWRIRSNITEQERRRWFALTDDGYSPTADWLRAEDLLALGVVTILQKPFHPEKIREALELAGVIVRGPAK